MGSRLIPILGCEDLSFPKKHTLPEVRCDEIFMKTCVVRRSYSEVSLWQICYSTVRGLTKVKTRRSLSDKYDGQLGDSIDEKMSIFSSTRLRKITGDTLYMYTNSSLLESGLKERKYHVMLFLRTCMSQKWM